MAIVQPANFGDILRNAPDVMSGNRFERVAAQNQALAAQIGGQMIDANAALALERQRGENLLRINREAARQQLRSGLLAQGLQNAASRGAVRDRMAGQAMGLAPQDTSDPAALAYNFNQLFAQLGLTNALMEPWTAKTRAGTNAGLGLG